MICSSCGAENRNDRKFCAECGRPLSAACPSCGGANQPGEKFCGECGTPLTAGASAAPPTVADAPSTHRDQPSSERRLVSVLFADLVGFTTLSESRDSEEVRELLSSYFETCRTLIGRYGGVVEKFIGDAVMAVWGTPTAKEDDAERAVRAALELTAAVAAMGQEVGAPDLRARAGVLTGEAAVTIGAVGEGMVAGDLVNTAARIQSAALPGQVYVGESTTRASEASIAYEDAGEHELKGKAEPLRLWRALRVVAGSRGKLRSTQLEAPFVGRDRELRLIKELFHASAEEHKAQLVSVTGIGGIGKSRLSWEFEKYVDGLAHDTFWHRGRCLSYGDGVAYWALADMVKMRCGIAEEDDPPTALAKLRETLAENLTDPEERRWVEPRVSQLLGLEEAGGGDQENMFSAWRIFFERLAQRDPTVLVFEDMQWSDAGLLDFIEYLLEWSRNYPLFILVLARPELADQRPSWGAGKRSFTALYLEPLAPAAMQEMLTGLVPGLPGDIRDRILERAQGIPLYAVETVRMLIDRGLLAQEGNVYRPTGPIESLEVPETLHALIAARLDGLAPDERRIIQDGAVLGKTFFKAGLAAVSGMTEDQIEPLLVSLVRKEVLSLQADPRSPERGQYGFLQDLVKKVAYDTLAKKDRKTKHLAAVGFIESSWTGEEEEIVEVVAAHLLDAYDAAPDAEDATEIKAKCRGMLERAGERARSLASPAEAMRNFEQALRLADDAVSQAELHEAAGIAASAAARPDDAMAHLEASKGLFEGAGLLHPAARVSARLAEAMWERGRLEHGLEMMDEAFQSLSKEEPDEDLAWLAAQLGRFAFFGGDKERGLLRIEVALSISEARKLPEVLSQALNTKALILFTQGRPIEGLVLLRSSLDIALEHDKPSAALRAYYNVADLVSHHDGYREAKTYARDGLALARRVGNRGWEYSFLALAYPSFALGDWDEARSKGEELPSEDDWGAARWAYAGFLATDVAIDVHRGDLDEAERRLKVFGEMETSADVQEQAVFASAAARVRLHRGEHAEALRFAEVAIGHRGDLGFTHEGIKEAFPTAVEAALRLGDTAKAEELLSTLETLPAGSMTRFLLAQDRRLRARFAEISGLTEDCEPAFTQAIGLFREMFMPFYTGVTLLEYAEWLIAHGREADARPHLDEASGIFEHLRARPWLERLAAAEDANGPEVVAG